MSDPIRKIALSRYAQARLAARPALAAELADPKPFSREEMRAALGADLAGSLRRLRERVLLRVMARDLAGLADLGEVCATMSALAEVAIEAGLKAAGAEDLVVVGMGKLGGGELNVSSDIDLIFVHPGDLDDEARYERAGRALIRLLSEMTAEGYVFRVDMRLRPYGESGPLACSLAFLENYLVTQGREWERYAWIKARALSGAPSFRDEIFKTVKPFVFRKYLDYGTLSAMRALHAEVRRDVARRELAEHVKLGPGGIREVEFIAQALQLIRGGRDPELQAKPTLRILSLLAERNLLPEAAARELCDAYVFLRNVEHRLQYLDDAQRHDLPEDAEDRRRVAEMSGFASWDAFYAALAEKRAAVSRHFDGVFAEKEAQSEPWPDHPRLAAFRRSQKYAALSGDSRRRLDVLLPAIGRASRGTPDPHATLARGMDLVEAIASRGAYLALLAERPEALERVTRMISASSWAADFVSRHPLLLDELLDDRVLYAAPDLAAFERTVGAQLAHAQDDTERRMNVLREAHQAQVFRLLAQDLAGLLTVERLADHLSALADRVLDITLREVWKDVRAKMPEAPEAPRFAVVSYGKLGGKELGYASDLDIIFLHEGGGANEDDSATQVAYGRLGTRMVSWLSSATASGILFETDLALRPSGSKGLLVQPIAGFERYQQEDAWTWEHQALTRARFSAGDPAVGARFEAIREAILTKPRDAAALAADILAMRERIAAAHPNRSGLFDVKHDRGGMIDIEFMVQYLVLAHAARFPDLTKNLGNIALLGMAAGFSLIEKAVSEKTASAYREYRRAQHMLRLNGAQYARVKPEVFAPEREAVQRLWETLFSRPGA
ncbi:MAG TPA: bifunctional [glutamate--ammonia ligase]-adenylyl-L-tyrosine phosphorylase/[glutamate--ammonia-ligase] adenylyltransferase [Burkholderiales bacterium]|nr:bifunctional [glutamate--ammonia ligase]-adenylyl-L-tyrosine phosphorylase/[glutamate--ammonia-ligase] adenylyltransferase [Burkholderiales bacterium]